MARSSPPAAQLTVGRYQVINKLADGAMSRVLKAHDPVHRTNVAIKLATTAVARDPVLRKRFEQEYRIIRSLSHPNIVQALDYGEEGGRPFMVLELVEGEDLWARIARVGQVPEAEAIDYITQVGQGLHEAHKHGILHRDLKPDNVLLTADGRAKLADLGLSKDLEADLGLTCQDKGLGTPNFIAPEQFRDAKSADVRCDIYGLAATLYMALTGKLPFDGDDLLVVLQSKCADRLTPPRKLVPSLSEAVDWAVRRALQADPSRRPASFPEFLAALRGEVTDSGDARPGGRPAGRTRSGASDRRGAVRYACSLPIVCTINLSVHSEETEWLGQWDAQVVNLSVRGIGVRLSRRFEPGTALGVTLASKDGRVRHTRQLRVVRVARADGRTWFVGGMLTEKLSREELRQLL